ncbi:MAG: N-acetylmuramoyl-L-alanine amidase [Guyparkeria sp.]
MKTRQQLVKSRDKTSGGGNDRTHITIHETASYEAGGGAQAHADLQTRGNPRDASWHWQVDDTVAIQSFPHSVRCWHAGDGMGEDSGGDNSIAIEICVNSDSDFEQALQNAAQLARSIMRSENIPLKNVVQHHDWSGKDCPRWLRNRTKGIDWEDFLDMVQDPDAAPPHAGRKAKAKPGRKDIKDMADEVINGIHGSGHARRRDSLGVSWETYRKVRAEVNRRFGITPGSENPGRSVDEMADEVIDGKHGNGHDARRKSLGVSEAVYEKVRAEVNRRYGVDSGGSSSGGGKTIDEMATEVVEGKHGNGHDNRRRSLGISAGAYAKVRAEVNRRLL